MYSTPYLLRILSFHPYIRHWYDWVAKFGPFIISVVFPSLYKALMLLSRYIELRVVFVCLMAHFVQKSVRRTSGKNKFKKCFCRIWDQNKSLKCILRVCDKTNSKNVFIGLETKQIPKCVRRILDKNKSPKLCSQDLRQNKSYKMYS